MTWGFNVKVGVVMASALLGAACTQSADLPTNEVDANVNVHAYSDRLQLHVILSDGLATVELSPGDKLTAAMDADKPVELEETELGSYQRPPTRRASLTKGSPMSPWSHSPSKRLPKAGTALPCR